MALNGGWWQDSGRLGTVLSLNCDLGFHVIEDATCCGLGVDGLHGERQSCEDNEEGVAVRIWLMPGNTGLGLSHRTSLVFHSERPAMDHAFHIEVGGGHAVSEGMASCCGWSKRCSNAHEKWSGVTFLNQRFQKVHDVTAWFDWDVAAWFRGAKLVAVRLQW